MTGNRKSTTMARSPDRLSPTLPLSSNSSISKNSMTFNQQFTDIIRRYKDYCQHIQRILKETDRSYNDITDTRVLTTDKMTEMQISKSDREYLNGLETRSLALIISSQTYIGKSRFINELLNESLLPETPINDIIRIVRMTVENHSIIETTSDDNDLQIIITPTHQQLDIKQIPEKIIPIFIYIIDQDILSDIDIDELKYFRSIASNEPILFIRIDRSDMSSGINETSCIQIFRQLCHLGFLTTESTDNPTSLFQNDIIDNELVNFMHFLNYIRKYTDRLLIRAVNILQRSHEVCLDFFNDSAFDMARDMLVTPRRLSYAREKEKKLYESLVELTYSKQNEIQRMILESVNEIRERLVDDARSLEIPGIELTDQLTVKNARDFKKCTATIQDFVLLRLNEKIANKLLDSINVLHDNYVGTLTRCLFSLENNGGDDDESDLSASKALQEILHSAYRVNIVLPDNSNLLQILVDRMKEFFRTLSWSNLPRIDPEFKCSVALNMLNGLEEGRLSKSVCTQLNDRIRLSHDSFETLLKQLEDRHSDRLKSTEDKQQRVRKECTPKIARLLLESTSLKDLIQHGLPKQGGEVGRGQYGVVYECKSWAHHRSCVCKSVVPPDDRHWNDLALEFHYLRRIPEHPRIVKLIGSVIDYRNPDQTPVLLIMERLKRDLYTALKNRLDFSTRMRIALDVVEGLRYLHGLGLVHRDIKLKNVLLDESNRARLTDLGFCKPEVMMSGSLVGTPIHMAPELFTSKYDHTVDIYAFGILFWYICSNGIKLPSNFDVCSSKDTLWSAVKKGARPERLTDFSDECWEIMTNCWNSQPSLRPYLGEVQEKIEQILNTNRPTTT